MTRLFLTLGVVAVWVGLTTLAALLTPNRLDLRHARLAVDAHRVAPPAPVTVEKATAQAEAVPTTTTTTTAPQAPRRYTTPGPTVRRPYQDTVIAPGSEVERWRSLVATYGDWDVNLMLAIMGCESGGDPNDRNRSSGAAGLLQIYPAQPGSFDPTTNIAQGHAKWLTSGYTPWNPSRGCWG